MADSVKLKINRGAIGKLLKEPGVARDLTSRANRIAAAAGPGMAVDSRLGRTRARASVTTATQEARRAEAEQRALTNAIGAGRG